MCQNELTHVDPVNGQIVPAGQRACFIKVSPAASTMLKGSDKRSKRFNEAQVPGN